MQLLYAHFVTEALIAFFCYILRKTHNIASVSHLNDLETEHRKYLETLHIVRKIIFHLMKHHLLQIKNIGGYANMGMNGNQALVIIAKKNPWIVFIVNDIDLVQNLILQTNILK